MKHAILVALACAACTNNSDSTLTVVNNSDFTIVQLFVTGVDNPDFGPNLLGGEPLAPSDTITIDVACGTYDAELIDETGVTCDLSAIDLCFADATWVITNTTCAVF